PMRDRRKLPVDRVEPAIHRVEPAVDPVKPALAESPELAELVVRHGSMSSAVHPPAQESTLRYIYASHAISSASATRSRTSNAIFTALHGRSPCTSAVRALTMSW